MAAAVFMKGEVVAGDSEKFHDLTKGLSRVTVFLSGPGGMVSEALQIGAELRERNFSTFVLPEQSCYSACSLIWISGVRRYMSRTSVIGFHAAWINKNGRPYETGMGNAEIGSFLTHLGLRVEAIRFITQAPPDQVSLLTPEIARGLGIEVYEQSGVEIATPQQKPTADNLVRRAALFAGMAGQCRYLFGLDEELLRKGAEAAVTEGNRIAGGEAFAKLVVDQIEVTKAEIANDGPVKWCLRAESRLRKQGVNMLPPTPSFDCTKASTESELAICGDLDLAARDRATVTLYRAMVLAAGASGSRQIKDDQRRWLQTREACGGDIPCLKTAYDLRVQQLSHP